MTDIITRLLERKAAGNLGRKDPEFEASATPPLTPHMLTRAEEDLGFSLPPLLRRIYTEVANGGFGYSYGLLGLLAGPRDDEDRDAVQLYLDSRDIDPDDPHWQWPHGLLPIADLGCNMLHCVQCTRPDAPVVLFDPNAHERSEPWDDAFFPSAPSLVAYFEAWLDGKDLLDTFGNDGAED